MKKIFGMLLVLVIIYLGIQICFRYFGTGHEYQYQVTTNDIKFNVKEKFVNNTKNELNSYYFEISNDGVNFYYQTLYDFNKKDHIIEDIYSYKNNEYNCILPIFEGGKIITDIMCLKNNVIYYYHDIKPSQDLQMFAQSLKEHGYDINTWYDVKESVFQENITINPKNIINNHHIGLSNYKGVYIINPTVGNVVENIKLFESDVYKRPLSIVFNNYYVTVNYNEQYRFTKIFAIDLTNTKTKEISCEREISFDSYIQGTYDDSIYIFDRDSKKQYEINIKNGKVLEIGNESSGVIIHNGDEKERISANEAKNNNIIFSDGYCNDIDINGYDKVDCIGGQETGYYYIYKKKNNKFEVYRTNKQNLGQLTYIFSTTDLNRIVYYDEYVYFLDGNNLKYYSDTTGVKTVLENKELSFNESIIFGVHTK